MGLDFRFVEAVRKDNIAEAEQLLAEGANINVAEGANIDIIDKFYHMNCLQIALAENHRKLAILLCERGIDINYQNKDGLTALHLAAIRLRDRELVDYLCQKGAKFDSVLHQLAFEGNLKELQLCSQAQSLFVKDSYNNTLLHYAEVSGNFEMIMWLLENGVDINVKNNHGMSILLLAVERRDLTLLQYLVERKVNLEIEDDYRYVDKVMLLAATQGHLAILKWLNEKTNNSLLQRKNSENVLKKAVENGHLSILHWLIEEMKVSIAVGQFNTTLLEIAARFKKQAMFDALLTLGAGIHASFHDMPEQVNSLFGIIKRTRASFFLSYHYTSCVLINAKWDNKRITREMPLFSTAITNVRELQETLADNIPLNITALHHVVTTKLIEYPEDQELLKTARILVNLISLKQRCLFFVAAHNSVEEIEKKNILSEDLIVELKKASTAIRDLQNC